MQLSKLLTIGLGISVLALGTSQMSAANATGSDHACPAPWRNGPDQLGCAQIRTTIEVPTTFDIFRKSLSGTFTESIRGGYLSEATRDDQGKPIPFRGNIVFLEGLGDSILNHEPLFTSLTAMGYRVIAFDYMGQGGSTGLMNNTRIDGILQIAASVWKKFGNNLDQFPKPILLGWSTGGLASYVAAARAWPSAVILIAPGIVPKKTVGLITLASLTRNSDSAVHLDPIRPRSPFLVPAFAWDLLATAGRMQKPSLRIPSYVPGLVFLSGDDDKYVKAAETRAALKRSAGHFEVVQFPEALHEIDNEVPKTTREMRDKIAEFLKRLL